MTKIEYVYKNSEKKIKELRMWNGDDYLGAYVLYKDGTRQFETCGSWFTLKELKYITKSVTEYEELTKGEIYHGK